ncbi:MAG: hypothetical protein M3Z33_08895 [Actinomycetota bacterium]|nr:hypothetical protein [Actinomycetota bacterium]
MAAAATLLAALGLAAGMGWLYLLRDLGLFEVGPKLPGALPLEQLARADDQPLLRVTLAWLTAGAIAGWALSWASGARRAPRALMLTGLALVLLFVSGAAADAIAVSSNDIVGRIPDQASHEGLWTELALVFIGSFAFPRRSSTARPAGPGGATPS